MKKLAREIASLIDKGKYLVVVPGFDSSFLSYLREEAGKIELLSPWALRGARNGETLVTVTNFATPSLISWADYVIFHTSEELMWEGYLKPFKIAEYVYDSPVSWLRYSKRRVEELASLAGNDALVIPANVEEGRSLERMGVRVAFSLTELRREERVILARRFRFITPYLQVRSAVLGGGTLLDIGGNSGHEEWSKVTLGELGLYPAREMRTPHSSSADMKQFRLRLKTERTVQPRETFVTLEVAKGKLTLAGKTIGEYRIRGGVLILKLRCPRESTLAMGRVYRPPFLYPASTGRCTFYSACLIHLKGTEVCKELAMRAYLLLRNHVNRVSNTNFSEVVRSALKDLTMREIMIGKRIVLEVDGEEIPVKLRGEGGYLWVECQDCLKFRRVPLRVKDLNTNYTKLARVLKDLLLKEMTTWRHRT